MAEARIASDQSFHHLKILTSGTGDAGDAITGSLADVATQQADIKRRHKSSARVYSQDFKFFKIIPSHTDANQTTASGTVRAMNESATNAIYWKVDPRLTATVEPTAADTEFSTRPTPSTELPTKPATTTIITTTTASNPTENVIETTSTTTTTTTTTTTALRPTTKTETTKDILKPSPVSTTNNSQLDPISEVDVEEINSNDIAYKANGNSNEKYVKTLQTTEKSLQYDDDDDDDDDRSYEDYAVETYDRTVVRKNKVRVHTSYQIASAFTGLPLRQGFLATTGYPRYYIGESNCSWTLTAPHGHRVRLTVLDLNLRGRCQTSQQTGKVIAKPIMLFYPVDERCRDELEIIDQNNVIFSGCQELAKPMQIVSDSNEIRVSVRTTSRLAYPKRGVLIHYTGKCLGWKHLHVCKSMLWENDSIYAVPKVFLSPLLLAYVQYANALSLCICSLALPRS